MSSKQISYPSLKAILQYMEANQRIQLSIKCPEVRTADRVAPLYARLIYLGRTFIQINKILYHFGVIRHFPPNCGPELFHENNRKGGAQNELDDFSTRDLLADYEFLEGDVFIQSPDNPIVIRDEEEDNQMHEGNVRRLEDLRMLEEVAPDEERRELMELMEAGIYTWQHRKQGVKPTVTHFIQMTTVLKEGRRIERVEYRRRMYEGVKYIFNRFLGNRKFPVRTPNLRIDLKGGIIRLPETLKFHVSGIGISCQVDQIMRALEDVIVEESFPLDHLKINGTDDFGLVRNSEHQVVRTARRVTFYNRSQTNEWFDIIMNAENLILEFLNCCFSTEQLSLIVDKLVAEKRCRGTRWSFGMEKKEQVMDFLHFIARKPGFIAAEYEECPEIPFLLVLPITEETTLQIRCNYLANTSYYEDKERPNWLIKISVGGDVTILESEEERFRRRMGQEVKRWKLGTVSAFFVSFIGLVVWFLMNMYEHYRRK